MAETTNHAAPVLPMRSSRANEQELAVLKINYASLMDNGELECVQNETAA